MIKNCRYIFATLLLLPALAHADLLVIPKNSAPAVDVVKPDRGMSMAQVIEKFGEPATRHPSVGGSSKHQPKITRWDYPAFKVVFENDHVIDAVVPDNPPPLFDTQELTPMP
jgi:hypothetical protein